MTLNLTFKNDGIEFNSRTECFVVLRFHLSSALPSGASVVPIISLPFRVTCSSKSTCGNSNPTDSSAEHATLAAELQRGSACNQDDVMRGNAIMNIGESTCASCIRESRVGDVTVYVLESPGLLGIGGKVWDSTFVLVEFLRNKGSSFISGKRVVELGSGTGITGTVLYITSRYLACLLSSGFIFAYKIVSVILHRTT